MPKISDEAAKPIVEAVVDIFSPATELLGWLGDSVRVHRARTVLKCFALTKKIADEAGITLKAPPTKFISQYIENASLEEEDNDKLIEYWARILVNAGENYRDNHVFYVNILKQISVVELELLEVLVRNGRGRYRLKNAQDAEFAHDFEFPGENLVLTDTFIKTHIQKSVKSIREAFERPGLLILDIFVDDECSNQWQESHPDYTDDELSSWQMLQSLQLIRLNYQRFISKKIEYRIRFAILTELGSEFYFSCHDDKLANKMSDRARFTRTHKKTTSK
jgi:hypothetical protein